MNRLLLPLLLLLCLLCACSSSTSMADHETLSCGPGRPLEINAGLGSATSGRDPNEDLSFLVEVANNSHEDVVIESVRIDPDSGSQTRYRIAPAFQTVNQEIPQNKDFLFRLPASQHSMVGAQSPGMSSSGVQPSMTVIVNVKNGDSYRCSFAIGQ
jgi:hypothetical protein